jgi:drug/metabolite transporter (DMT)-like permease
MDEKKRTLRGFLCAALGGVCWGASGTVGQYLFTCQGVDSGWLTVVRMFLAGVVLLGGALVRHRPQLRAIWSDRRDALRLVLSPQALFWGLCAAVSLMLYTLLPGDLLRRYPVSVCTGCGMFIGGVVLLVLTQAWRIPVALNAAVALGTLEISVVGTALAFTLYLQGVSDVGGVRASLLACTEPVSAALCAALWLHTSFAWQDLLGFAAILVMAVLIALPERASEKSTEKAEN